MEQGVTGSLCIAIAAKGRVDVIPCLQALSANIADNEITIHIAHDQELPLESIHQTLARNPSNDNAPRFRAPKLLTTRCPDSTSILKLWGAALANTSARYAAVLDAHCPPTQQWLAAVVENMQQEKPAFYGSVEPGWELRDRNIIGYLTEYSQFKAPIDCDTEFPGNNIVFKTELLESAASLRKEGFFKTFMLWKLTREHNDQPLYCDNMPIIYKKEFNFRHYIKRRRDHGRCFGATRLKQDQQPARWLCIAFTPFLFLLRTIRIFQWSKNKPDIFKACFFHLPTIIISELAWSWGEFLGYSFGDNGCCQHLD